MAEKVDALSFLFLAARRCPYVGRGLSRMWGAIPVGIGKRLGEPARAVIPGTV